MKLGRKAMPQMHVFSGDRLTNCFDANFLSQSSAAPLECGVHTGFPHHHGDGIRVRLARTVSLSCA
jgi:hypothetical protein